MAGALRENSFLIAAPHQTKLTGTRTASCVTTKGCLGQLRLGKGLWWAKVGPAGASKLIHWARRLPLGSCADHSPPAPLSTHASELGTAPLGRLLTQSWQREEALQPVVSPTSAATPAGGVARHRSLRPWSLSPTGFFMSFLAPLWSRRPASC